MQVLYIEANRNEDFKLMDSTSIFKVGLHLGYYEF